MKEGVYERMTKGAIEALRLANEEATSLRHEYIGPEHILLSMLRAESEAAMRVLAMAKLDPTLIHARLTASIFPGSEELVGEKRPQLPRTKHVLEYAVEESCAAGHQHVGTEHLLLGLLRDQETVPAQVILPLLTNQSLDLDTVRCAVRQLNDPFNGLTAASTCLTPDQVVEWVRLLSNFVQLYRLNEARTNSVLQQLCRAGRWHQKQHDLLLDLCLAQGPVDHPIVR